MRTRLQILFFPRSAALLVLLAASPALKAQDYLMYSSSGASTTVALQDTGNFFVYGAGFSNPAHSGPVTVAGAYSETKVAGSMAATAGPYSLQIQGGPDDTSVSSADLYADVTFDFTGLAGGALPSTAGFGLLDVDGSITTAGPTATTLENLRAYDVVGALITTPWLTNIITFDFNGAPPDGQPDPSGPSDYPTVTYNGGGSYTVTGALSMTDSPLLTAGFTQEISKVEYRYFAPHLSTTNTFFSVPQVVPEPSTVSLGVIAAAATGLLRRRRIRPGQGVLRG